MRFDIVTIFPGMFDSLVGASLIKRAIDAGKVEIHAHDLRGWTDDKHHITDDSPYGGGPGMVMKVAPFARAVKDLRGRNPGAKVALMTPQGQPFTQQKAWELSRLPGLIILCGKYEGVDERVRVSLCDMEISMGDYVLTGGEIPAMAVTDAVARLIPGVVGDHRSTLDESHTASLLEYPQYTRPAEHDGLKVPDILLNGNHEKIRKWRREQSIIRTAQRRPDLISSAVLTDDEREIVERMGKQTATEPPADGPD